MVPLRFHWSPYSDGNACDAASFLDLCRSAETLGIESVEVADAPAAAAQTASIRFRIGLSGEIKRAAEILGRRLIVHVKWDETPYFAPLFELSEAPEIHVEGQSAEAAFFAIKHADCLWRLPSRPNQVYADALPVLHFGKEVGLVSSIVARATRQEALDAAATLLPAFTDSLDDATCWITPYLWTGASQGRVTMLGSFEELAEAIYGFKQKGISQFLFRGWADTREMNYFGNGVLPLVRELERESR